MDNYASQGMMQTIHKGWVNLLEPTAEQIHWDDMVGAAANIRRFNGHSSITLEKHSLHVYHILRKHLRCDDKRLLRTGLMHDLHEVYVADMPSPMKAALRQGTPDGVSAYDRIEQGFMQVVADKFGLIYPHPEEIKIADMYALAMEADMTWGTDTGKSWGLTVPFEVTNDRNITRDMGTLTEAFMATW